MNPPNKNRNAFRYLLREIAALARQRVRIRTLARSRWRP
jgi:hypothetical protein